MHHINSHHRYYRLDGSFVVNRYLKAFFIYNFTNQQQYLYYKEKYSIKRNLTIITWQKDRLVGLNKQPNRQTERGTDRQTDTHRERQRAVDWTWLWCRGWSDWMTWVKRLTVTAESPSESWRLDVWLNDTTSTCCCCCCCRCLWRRLQILHDITLQHLR